MVLALSISLNSLVYFSFSKQEDRMMSCPVDKLTLCVIVYQTHS